MTIGRILLVAVVVMWAVVAMEQYRATAGQIVCRPPADAEVQSAAWINENVSSWTGAKAVAEPKCHSVGAP
ncbi:hypothetical protein SAMN04489710_107241 [Paracidovorax konjaci]|uniref:Uncharacterized protein n=1 Tax=Paracidovorax konjaci TaxID=32040 RepID=A0A1I1VVS9_9BURK|nr:hypothetical protein SAMN04489710_107241 [Paracidovorax konjaci]